ncbi:conserved hypothetical protein [Talaromyces stipitatus ATCC 10500]|uniref:DUF1688 domain protein n=1 Tax=Talaromyces stipitatus (strain ATCC 10500 / CBS 375.48 / QM 6759 / NRRL 1006) TaxID=441959 RepID=B8MGH6_TALSN|nr:uncharacterized protein TSTA_013940 [Talaromyces stipitatus ATCC 10500]EED16296.1 conserved hypothetical protein [Talaromyces stipitatus ATCC 10500]
MDSEIEYILSLKAVREKAHKVLELAEQGKLTHFNYDRDKLDVAADYVIGIIQRDFGPDRYHLIPPHGRWQHFEVGGIPRIDKLLSDWKNDQKFDDVEKVRGLIDLFFVSVLLDAGAGDVWRFQEPGGEQSYSRSEGIAIASLHMFLSGDFASDKSLRKDIVEGAALHTLDADKLYRHFQISETNPLVAVDKRVELLRRLGSSLLSFPEIFGKNGRPGNLVDYLLSKAKSSGEIDYRDLWNLLQKVLIPVWPSDRTHIDGHPVGDAWPLKALATSSRANSSKTSAIQPFHKLTQWLAYSLMVPFDRLLKITWLNADQGTGLAEYRNGGLFVDIGVLSLKEESRARGLQLSSSNIDGLPYFGASDDEIVEWRAMTVALLDKLHAIISSSSQFNGIQLTLPQVLEAGSWKAGRELAAEKRPLTKSSPIGILGDGTLF